MTSKYFKIIVILLSLLLILFFVSLFLIRLYFPEIIAPKYSDEEYYCEFDSDCIQSTALYSCCGGMCGGGAMNKEAERSRRRWQENNCKYYNVDKNCPSANCLYIVNEVKCKNNICVLEEVK